MTCPMYRVPSIGSGMADPVDPQVGRCSFKLAAYSIHDFHIFPYYMGSLSLEVCQNCCMNRNLSCIPGRCKSNCKSKT